MGPFWQIDRTTTKQPVSSDSQGQMDSLNNELRETINNFKVLSKPGPIVTIENCSDTDDELTTSDRVKAHDYMERKSTEQSLEKVESDFKKMFYTYCPGTFHANPELKKMIELHQEHTMIWQNKVLNTLLEIKQKDLFSVDPKKQRKEETK